MTAKPLTRREYKEMRARYLVGSALPSTDDVLRLIATIDNVSGMQQASCMYVEPFAREERP